MLYFESALIGVIAGGAYALLGVAVTLMFRTTGVLSFAHAAFAMVGAYVYTDLVTTQGWPVVPAVATTLVIVVVYGLAVERIAIRPVSNASGAVKLIATLAVFALTAGLVGARYGATPNIAPFALPARVVHIFGLAVPYQRLAIVALATLVTAWLVWFLRTSPFGMAVRAAAEDRRAARLVGVPPARVARFNWALGALVAGAVGVLVAPLSVFNVATFPVLLMKAFIASLFGGLASVPLTFLGGLLVGATEGVVPVVSTTPGAQELVLLLLIVGLLVARRNSRPAQGAELVFGSGAHTVPVAARLASAAADAGAAVRARLAGLSPLLQVAALAAAAYAVARPATDEFWGVVGARGLFFAIEALALVVLTGWAGQVSLMQGAYAGVGAFMTSLLAVTHDVPLELTIPLAAVAGMAMGLVVGLPALRLSSLQFAIASVVFAAAASSWLFRWEGVAYSIPRGTLFGIDLFDSGNLYLVMLAVTGVLFLLAWNVRRSTFGSVLLVCRDAPVVATHFGVRPDRVLMRAFLFASFIAGIGGSFFGIVVTTFNPVNYGLQLSILLLLYAVVGGVDSLAGPVIAGFVFGILPEIVQSGGGQASGGSGFEILSGALVVLLIVWRPRGLASLLRRRRGTPSRAARGGHGGHAGRRGARAIAYGRLDIALGAARQGGGAPPVGADHGGCAS